MVKSMPKSTKPRLSRSNVSLTDAEKQQMYVTIWSKAVDTQMHFNEMLGETPAVKKFLFVAAALGLGVVLLTRSRRVFNSNTNCSEGSI